jgi:H+-translocating NAD(P) transhydrogenase subunit alpha
MKIGVPLESYPGEKRVAIVPEVVGRLQKLGVEVLIEEGAGIGSHYPDPAFQEVGAVLIHGQGQLLGEADLVLRVQPPTEESINLQREGSIAIGFMNPSQNPESIKAMCARRIASLALELLPRVTRAQAMDALTSQASVAGYKAALMAADHLGKFLPMLTTPTGTIRPAKVLVIGAGVAGLQAIATARRLGAMVEAYDVRTATKEQVESLGAKFLQASIKAEAEGGYARELTAEEKQLQQEMLAKYIAQADAVIATASIPGQTAPRIITKEMVESMRPGSVIIDLAAESGGNCELTQVGKSVHRKDVEVYGPINVPSMLPVHASEMYAKNLFNLLVLMIKDGQLAPDWEDEVLRESTLTRDGEIKHAPTRQLIEGEKQ